MQHQDSSPHSASTILDLLRWYSARSANQSNGTGVKHISTLCLPQGNSAMLPAPLHLSSGGSATLGISSEVMQKEQFQCCP